MMLNGRIFRWNLGNSLHHMHASLPFLIIKEQRHSACAWVFSFCDMWVLLHCVLNLHSVICSHVAECCIMINLNNEYDVQLRSSAVAGEHFCCCQQ